jgi:hypothetical protein
MVNMQTDVRDFTVKNADILFPYTIKELKGVMNIFGLKNGFVKVTPLISCQGLVRRAREK